MLTKSKLHDLFYYSGVLSDYYPPLIYLTTETEISEGHQFFDEFGSKVLLRLKGPRVDTRFSFKP